MDSYQPSAQPETPNKKCLHMVTVRMEEELHEALKIASHKHLTSMNKLCIDMFEHCLNSMNKETNSVQGE